MDGRVSSKSDSGISGSSSETSSGKVDGSTKMRPLFVICRSCSGGRGFEGEYLGVSFSFCESACGTNSGDVCCCSTFGDADIVSPTSWSSAIVKTLLAVPLRDGRVEVAGLAAFNDRFGSGVTASGVIFLLFADRGLDSACATSRTFRTLPAGLNSTEVCLAERAEGGSRGVLDCCLDVDLRDCGVSVFERRERAGVGACPLSCFFCPKAKLKPKLAVGTFRELLRQRQVNPLGTSVNKPGTTDAHQRPVFSSRVSHKLAIDSSSKPAVLAYNEELVDQVWLVAFVREGRVLHEWRPPRCDALGAVRDATSINLKKSRSALLLNHLSLFTLHFALFIHSIIVHHEEGRDTTLWTSNRFNKQDTHSFCSVDDLCWRLLRRKS